MFSRMKAVNSIRVAVTAGAIYDLKPYPSTPNHNACSERNQGQGQKSLTLIAVQTYIAETYDINPRIYQK
ncbi:hypothetical protein [Levilactobacillus yonginensis]|uniref:hypothetical protein n=1 Tax=Levilactobacillus yonginensis TaxID=1054041 RepID=UPI0013DE1B70|nr:hypothetical protein [Levilactobacillus yonginensis]